MEPSSGGAHVDLDRIAEARLVLRSEGDVDDPAVPYPDTTFLWTDASSIVATCPLITSAAITGP
jgi:hypothetical protein